MYQFSIQLYSVVLLLPGSSQHRLADDIRVQIHTYACKGKYITFATPVADNEGLRPKSQTYTATITAASPSHCKHTHPLLSGCGGGGGSLKAEECVCVCMKLKEREKAGEVRK